MIEENQPVNFWKGVVTVIDDDPEKLGRVRVRIFGKHHPDPNILKNEDLPLAQSLLPPIYASMSGLGHSPTGLLPGSWVIGFYLDPQIENMPVILGTVPTMQFPEDNVHEADVNLKDGRPQDLIYGIEKDDQHGWVNKADKFGFSDPAEIYPLYTSRLPDGKKINASDVNSKVQDTFEYNEHDFRKRKDTLMVATDVGTATDPRIESLTEREPYMAAPQYMKNHVRETESGHIQEFDDTPGKERIYTQHKSGTFQEIQHDGSRITKVYGDDYEICLREKKIIINGRGDSGLTVIVNGDVSLTTSGSVVERVFGDYVKIVHGKLTMVAKKGIQLEDYFGSVNISSAGESIILNANKAITIKSNNDVNLQTPTTIKFSKYAYFYDNVEFKKNCIIQEDLVVSGRSDARKGAASLGQNVIITPPKHPDPPIALNVPDPIFDPQPNPQDPTFPYNQCPVVGWSNTKSHSSGSSSGWDYHLPATNQTTSKKPFYLNNFSPIASQSTNSYDGNDGPRNASPTNFTSFDYFKFTYQQDKNFEWYEKPYKNNNEGGEEREHRFRDALVVSAKSSSSFGHAT